MQQINEEEKGEEVMEIKVNIEQNDQKLQVVTVGYCSDGLMKEEIITFTISWDLHK